MTGEARTVGCRLLEAADDVRGAVVPVAILYPATAPERTERFGPYPVDVALDSPPDGERLGVVAISHGNGGSPWTHRVLASALARAGYAVVLPEHVGNSRSDNSLAGTAANLENRPRHLALALDAVFAGPVIGPRLAADGVAVIGHSIGAYTALAAAGGRPWAGPHETEDGQPRPVRVAADPRVRALVLLAPATPWFLPEGSLAEVRVPILLRASEQDAISPSWNAEIVINGVADAARVEHAVVPGAGHFSFLSPFPPAMVRPDFPPSQDPEGFDRAAYQEVLRDDVLAFLRRHS
ncbi:MAG TPA: alpha/beta fold hydrolase [Longimicrobium sp.]|nr:alpha/beta fold hydrolase [Longimicrobium sp.]